MGLHVQGTTEKGNATMSTRAFTSILAALLAGCTAAANPSVSQAPAATAQQASAQASQTSADPTSSTCEPSGDGTFQAVVLGISNIFGAGREAPPAPGGGGGGALPPACDLPSGSTTVTIPAATGQVTPYVDQPLRNGAAGDRDGAGGENTDVLSYRGISGIVNRGNGLFLVGVFLADDEPSDPAPERLDFTNAEDFEELAPEIGQTFLIGDGVGRRFLIPAGATRLFLGFADAFLYEGAPGWYGNNAGALEVTIIVE
jgi:hypothetical protein